MYAPAARWSMPTALKQGWVLLGLLTLLAPTRPAQAQGGGPCDPSTALADIEALLEAQKELERSLARIETAMHCPEAAFSYELNLLSAVAALRRGDVPQARQWTAQALRLAQGEERRPALELQQILERSFSEVTFAQEEASQRTATVSLERFTLDVEAEVQTLAALLGPGLAPLGERAFEAAVDAQRSRLEARGGPTASLWWPRGTYQLDSGKKIQVAGGNQLSVFVDGESPQSFDIQAGLHLQRSMTPRTLALGHDLALGIQVGYTHRLGAGYFLRAGLGLFPIARASTAPDCTEMDIQTWEGDYDEVLSCGAALVGGRYAQTLTLGVLARRALTDAWSAGGGVTVSLDLTLGDAVGVPEVWVMPALPRASLGLGPDLELRYSLLKRWRVPGELIVRATPTVGLTAYISSPTRPEVVADSCATGDAGACEDRLILPPGSAWQLGGTASLGALFFF